MPRSLVLLSLILLSWRWTVLAPSGQLASTLGSYALSSRHTWVHREQDHLGKICLQADALDGFSCAAAEVRHRYKQKHLRTAFTQLPGAKDSSPTVSSKVNTGPMHEQQDRRGLM